MSTPGEQYEANKDRKQEDIGLNFLSVSFGTRVFAVRCANRS